MGPGERRGLVRHPGVLPPARMLLTRLGYPYVRRVQKRFGRESAAAMLKGGRGRGERTGLMLKYGIIRSTMGEENSWLDLPVNADSASRSGRS